MSRIQTILVPVDFSPASEQAARYAVELAQQLGAGGAAITLDLLHAWQLAGYATPSSELAKDTERELQAELDGFAARVIPANLTQRRHLRLGAPDEEIIRLAGELGANLIVMGTTGKTGLEHFLVGSVAERVIRSAEIPVVTVRFKKE